MHVYIHNQCPSSILPRNVTPYEKVFGTPPSVGHLRVFGSKCFVKVPDETRLKLDDKAKECRLIRFEGESIYVVVDMDHKRLRSHNIIFMENKPKRGDSEGTPVKFPSTEPEDTRDTSMMEDDELRKRQTRSEVWGSDPTRRSERISNKVLIMEAQDSPKIKIPKAYSNAINSPEGKSWKDAMDYELTKLEEMDTWSEIDRADILHGAQVLPGMWVHIVKNLESGERKFRSRWVVCGDQQKTHLSLSDTFAPVSRISSLRILLGLATLRNMHIFA